MPLLFWSLLRLSFLPFLPFSASFVFAQDTTTLAIVATTDVHGRLMSWDYEQDREAPLGLVRVATVVDSLRRVFGPDRVVLVDAGDLIQGNPFATYHARVAPAATHPIIAAMNRIGYDVVTPGNHEFNFGLPTLERIVAGARFRYVSANIVRDSSGVPMFERSVIVVKGGIRVGITGITTPGVMIWDGPNVAGRVRVTSARLAAPPVLQALAGRADVTVLLAHAGLDGASSYDEQRAPPEHEVGALLAAAPGTDVAVLGHTHREIPDSAVGTTLVVQARHHAQGVAVAEIRLVRDGLAWRVVSKRGRAIRLDSVRADPALLAAVQPAHEAARTWSRRPVGIVSAPMSLADARRMDTPVIDFINAVQMRVTGAELSATAAFNERGLLPAGPVTRGDVASIYPYENTLMAVRISGADLRAFLEHASRYYTGVGADGRPTVDAAVAGYNFDIVSGADYELDLSRPIGSRVTRLVVRGRDVQPTDSFTLAANSYRAQGGGGFTMLARAPRVYDRGEDMRELIAADLARRDTLRPSDVFVQNWRITGGQAVGRPGGHSDSIVLRVFATNDQHGRLLPRVETWSERRPVGGAAQLAGMMNRLAAECACNTIRVDGGDLMQGTPISNFSFGKAAVEAANAAGYAAVAIGNHEFDWTIDTLIARTRDARFTFVSSNIIELRTRRRPAWAVPWVITQAGTVRVAVVGYTAPGTSTSTDPRNVATLGFRGAPALDTAIAAARTAGAEIVIVAAHEGAFCQRDGTCQGEIVTLAQALRNRPDLIVSGHTHSLVTTTVNGIPIVQARTGATSLGIVDLVRGPAGLVANMRVATVWADRETPDTAVARVVARYDSATTARVSRRIATLAAPLARDSGLGELVAEALRSFAGADVAFVNQTGIRASFRTTDVSWGDVFEVLPFGNRVVRLEITGAALKQALEHGLDRGDRGLHAAGFRAEFDPARPAGSRLVRLTLDDGRAVTDAGRYRLATFDFLAAGGSGFAMLPGLPSTETGGLDVDVFIAYLQRLPQPVRVPAPFTPRITPLTR